MVSKRVAVDLDEAYGSLEHDLHNSDPLVNELFGWVNDRVIQPLATVDQHIQEAAQLYQESEEQRLRSMPAAGHTSNDLSSSLAHLEARFVLMQAGFRFLRVLMFGRLCVHLCHAQHATSQRLLEQLRIEVPTRAYNNVFLLAKAEKQAETSGLTRSSLELTILKWAFILILASVDFKETHPEAWNDLNARAEGEKLEGQAKSCEAAGLPASRVEQLRKIARGPTAGLPSTFWDTADWLQWGFTADEDCDLVQCNGAHAHLMLMPVDDDKPVCPECYL